jgi:hypothetical protein
MTIFSILCSLIVSLLLIVPTPGHTQTLEQKLKAELRQTEQQMQDSITRREMEEKLLPDQIKRINNQQLQCDSTLNKYKAMRQNFPNEPARWQKYENTYNTCLNYLGKLKGTHQRSLNVIKHEQEMYNLLKIRRDKVKAALSQVGK